MASPRSVVRWISIAALAAGVIAAGTLGFFALRRHVAGRVWTRFAACLTGPRLAETESAEVRVRRIWMTRHSTPEKLLPDEMPWPDRCYDPLKALETSWAVRSLVPAIEPIAKEMENEVTDNASIETSNNVELLWATAYTLPWNDDAAASVKPPPPPSVSVLDEPELAALRRACPGSAKLAFNGVDTQPLDRLLFSPIYAPGTRRVCTIGASPAGPFTAVSCAPAEGDRAGRVPEPRLEDIRKARGPAPAGSSSSMQSCHTKSAAVVVVTPKGDSEREDLDVYFVTGSEIPAPQKLTRAVLDPNRYPHETLGPVTIACGEEDVRLSWATGTAERGIAEHALFFARCTTSGCATETAKVTGLRGLKIAAGTWSTLGENRFNFVLSPLVIDLGGKAAALLWDRGDALVTRVAARDELTSTPDRVIVDDFTPESTHRELPGAAAVALQNASVVVRGDVAILLLAEHDMELKTRHQPDSVFPVRIGADGSVRPLLCEEAR